jgi:6-pyruvoyltetrahydropterin/6-carboxytetrahydropterin synthase
MTPEPASEQRHVTVEGVRLRFAAAHMATLGDDLEPLHGHNYEVRCRVDGGLTDDRWVIDFSVIKRLVREACEQLDHHFLLQRDSKLLDIQEGDDRWTVSFGSRAYTFPHADVVALPIENTTAELLAQWLWEQVVAKVVDTHPNATYLSVDVEEMPGQWGGYGRPLAPI